MIETREELDGLDGVPLPELAPRVVGHGTVLASIFQSLDAGRMPGAILLHGPQGIGKATLAFAVARDIFTRTGDEDAHRISEQVASGAYPNLFALRRQPKDGKGFYTVIRVEDVRELRERLHRTRGRAGYRVAIVDSIDDCNASAANALLKTLEEPPAETLFILVSHRPGQLLPTIKSRCHSLAMRPLADGEVRAVLDQSGVTAGTTEIDRAVALAHGRPRRAFEALLLADGGSLAVLGQWLANPLGFPPAAHLQLADALGADAGSAEAAFGREMVTDWLAAEGRVAAGAMDRRRLASATELWDKANALFAEQESLNLDARQTLVAIFDAIRRHKHLTASAPTEFK